MEGHKTLSGSKGYHRSVLLKEVLGALNIRDAWYLDCTLGDGGHTIEIIKRGGKVVGIDVDPQALGRVRKRFGIEEIDRNKWKLIVGNFRDLKKLILKQTDLKDQKFAGAKSYLAGAIFDLGVSSLQLETPSRGFSFSKIGPLDMRMDPTLEVRALDLINAGGRKQLYELFKNLGEEKYSKRLADHMVSARQVGVKIETTKDLADLVEQVVRKHGRLHPATKIFQALRIAVNDELNALKEGLDQVISLIDKNGHIIVISFHSLEDRIVKETFRAWSAQGWGQILTKKPIVPTLEEININPRARSAKMRVFERS
ncbi:MAG: 16S rRNA (cytosine(1402)-N(4))-methyltransferase RsmH [Candidatus Daviesbacteria bacterium]|nr:16S rRNA (cytosine(1402)-N(4))-methyltransferase RsmH [Candidatus Daviesbacteria bacterium]